jgi:hypothetical protein
VDIATRELLTFAMLVALGGCEPQVRGHVSANVKVGNDRARLIEVVTQLLPYIGYPRTLNGLRAIDEVAPAQPRTQAPDPLPLRTCRCQSHQESRGGAAEWETEPLDVEDVIGRYLT